MLKRKGMWSRKAPTPPVRLLKASGKFHLVIDIGCGNGRNMVFPISVGLDGGPRIRVLNSNRDQE